MKIGLNSRSGGNPNLRYDEVTKQIQAKDTKDYWVNIFATDQLPLKYFPSWADGTDAEIVQAVADADAGLINLSDHWKVGDERTVHLSAMAVAGGVDESHVAQDVTLVLMNKGGKTLTNGKECNFVVGMKNSLLEIGYVNSTAINEGGWGASQRRTVANSTFKNSFPSTLIPMFKQVKNEFADGGGNNTGLNPTSDYFSFFSEINVFGSKTFCEDSEIVTMQQFEYYKTEANRIKKLGDNGNAYSYWLGSPYRNNIYSFCTVSSVGSANSNSANQSCGLAFWGCI